MTKVENLNQIFREELIDLDLGNTLQKIRQLKHYHTKYFQPCDFVIFYVLESYQT